ncbi:MAG: DUF4372 domain-containing protein [Candidatus Thiodiazotropha sp.]
MSSSQTNGKQNGNQVLSHHNTVFSQLLKLIPRHEFETLAKQHRQAVPPQQPKGGRTS